MNVLNIWNFSFFQKRLKRGIPSFFFFFMCSVLKIFISLVKERESNDAFIFLFLFIHWNWKKESLNYCILIFYLREIILINFNALQICSKITKFKYLNFHSNSMFLENQKPPVNDPKHASSSIRTINSITFSNEESGFRPTSDP